MGPNFAPPALPTASGYAAADDRRPAEVGLTPGAPSVGPWWRALGSTTLDSVMTLALAHNQTVAAATATLDKVRAEAARERGASRPELLANASVQRERIDTAAFGFAGFPSPTITLFNIGPTVSYDFDIVGGERRRVEASTAAAEAEAGRADAAYLTLTANVALEALTIADLRARIEAAEAVVADDGQSLDILARAAAVGGDSRTAVLPGRLQLDQDLAVLPPLQLRLAQARHALSMLVGAAPGEWSPPAFALSDFTAPDSIPVALPSALVRLRPDIRTAEAQLHADTALVGVATARLYPDIRLVAGISQEGLSAGSLFGPAATAYYLGPQVSAPLFDGGARRADRRAAQAQARASLARYRQTVITAFVQVSDVLSDLAQDDARLAALDRVEADARASLEAARGAYGLGGAPLSRVVIAHRRWRQAAQDRIEAQGQKFADIVALYGATAADWRSATAPKSGAVRR